VISPDGLVLTNSHVVGSSKQIRLRDVEASRPMRTCSGSIPIRILALLRADGVRDLALRLAWRFEEPAPRPAGRCDRNPWALNRP